MKLRMRGLSIIEVLIVIAVISILMGIAIPKFQNLNKDAESIKERVENMSCVGQFFQGEHSVKSSENGYFTFTTTDGVQYVQFAWLNNQGEYIFTRLPVTKIRVQVANFGTPTVKFRWVASDTCKDVYDDKIVYVLISATEADWKQK